MYEYKGYRIVCACCTGFGYTVFAPNGRAYGPFASDTEAEAFIDDLIE